MKNLKKIVTLAALALALTLSLTSAKDANAATTMTKKQVAKAIAAAQEKAINKRKVVKVTVTFETKKKVWKYLESVDDLVGQIYWGKLYGTFGETGPFYLQLASYDEDFEGKWIGDVDNKISGKWAKDGSKYTVIFKFMGNNKNYKDAAKSRKCAEKIYDALVPTTASMTQAQKVCYVLEWFDGRMSYKLGASDTSAKAVWKGTAHGNCVSFSLATQKYLLMAGVKHVAYVRIPKANHSVVAVRLEDSRVYVIEPQSTGEHFNIDVNGDGDDQDDYDMFNMPEQAAIDYLAAMNYDTIQCWGSLKYKLSWEDGKTENFKASKNKAYYSKYSW